MAEEKVGSGALVQVARAHSSPSSESALASRRAFLGAAAAVPLCGAVAACEMNVNAQVRSPPAPAPATSAASGAPSPGDGAIRAVRAYVLGRDVEPALAFRPLIAAGTARDL